MKPLRCLSSLLVTALLCTAVPSMAQDTAPAGGAVDEARDRFKRGVDLFREGNFRAALIEFRRANEASPNYRIQFNLGQTYFELQDYAGALDAFERYLREGGSEVAPERKAEVEAEIEKLRKRVGRVMITTNVSGAEVLIDDTVVGTTPLESPVVVSAGRRKVSASKGPGIPTVRYVEVAGGDAMTVELVLAAETTTPAPAPNPTPEPLAPQTPQESPGMGTGFWVGLVATGVFTTGAVVSGIMASGAKSDYDKQLDTFPTKPADIQDARDRTDRYALMTDIFGGAALVAGVVTIAFAASGPSEPEPAAAVTPPVKVGIGPGSFVIDGRF
ncbi:MAG: hypothetical protein CVU63_12310 [Deltaproteobacteria bacterium HGW-Deltaproteobacteria-20]|nr:MAG: hypothetical protein CVU63_12310 [Deltaproteobacteria bacterium HGW-Deltaproteobacteria-20]